VSRSLSVRVSLSVFVSLSQCVWLSVCLCLSVCVMLSVCVCCSLTVCLSLCMSLNVCVSAPHATGRQRLGDLKSVCVCVRVPLSSNKQIHFKSQTESVLEFNVPRNHTNEKHTYSPESLQHWDPNYKPQVWGKWDF